MMRWSSVWAVVESFFLAFFSLHCAQAQREAIHLALVPSVETGIIQETGGKMAQMLSQALEKKVVVHIPTSYSAVVEGLRVGSVDVAFLPTLAFVLGKAKYGLKGVLMVVREGKVTYKGAIYCRKGIVKEFSQLRGKKFAFVEASSTSGFLYPLWLMRKSGLESSHLGRTFFAGGHDKVLLAIYSGKVDCGAAFFDARVRVEKILPDVWEKIEVIGLTEDIPSDTITVRRDFPLVEEIRRAFLELQKDTVGKQLLKKLYMIDGFAPWDEAPYGKVERLAREFGML
ncbi:MAG: phosphate/phosphite/phosphonate ABC transporter substrate-binding protein [bacterium JZ-2024 1]